MGKVPDGSQPSRTIRKTDGPVWYDDTGSDTVFVFVHGINSDNHACWLNSKSETFWPDLVSSDPNLNNPAIFLGGYPTDSESTCFGIGDAAEKLFSALRRKTQERTVLDCAQLFFICHSTGGLVVPR